MTTQHAVEKLASAIGGCTKKLRNGTASEGNYAYMKKKDLIEIKELIESLSNQISSFSERQSHISTE